MFLEARLISCAEKSKGTVLDLKHEKLLQSFKQMKDTSRNLEKELDTTWPRMLALSELLSNEIIVIHFKIK